jgi:transcriptional regulator with XRE-family HTH domain
MKTQFDIKQILAKGKIESELELERALIADRKLRLLAKESPRYKELRSQVRDIIAAYENSHWSEKTAIDAIQIRESDLAEKLADQERQFITHRKELIRAKLKSAGLNQQQFGLLLGHKNKSYISELMNGISPFSLRDIIVIHRLLKLELSDLVPTMLPEIERAKIQASITSLNIKKLKLSQGDLELV